MAITWTPDLATGIAEIDRQHRELFNQIKVLMGACSQGKGCAEIANMVGFLEDFAYRHFASEEEAMTRHHYPDYTAHKSEHIELLKKLVGIKQMLEQKGPTLDLVLCTNHFALDWVKAHMKKSDVAFGQYLQKQRGTIVAP